MSGLLEVVVEAAAAARTGGQNGEEQDGRKQSEKRSKPNLPPVKRESQVLFTTIFVNCLRRPIKAIRQSDKADLDLVARIRVQSQRVSGNSPLPLLAQSAASLERAAYVIRAPGTQQNSAEIAAIIRETRERTLKSYKGLKGAQLKERATKIYGRFVPRSNSIDFLTFLSAFNRTNTTSKELSVVIIIVPVVRSD